MDDETKRATRSESDERAVANGCYYRQSLADHVIEFFARCLRHSKGQWAGEPFTLLDWQREDIINPLFGWLRKDGTRRFRETYIEIPKKNGKSTIAAGIGLYMLCGDDEGGAEIYSVATKRDQAGLVHEEAVKMVRKSPSLFKRLRINKTNYAIRTADGESVYKAIASEPGGNEGLNTHCAIIDELHAWPGRELWNALYFSGAARSQPLLFVITTAGDNMQSQCWDQHEKAQLILNGQAFDQAFLPYIRAADPEDDWTAEETWYKANPSLGVTLNVEEMARACEDAKKSPTQESTFKRYRLNIWNTTENPWLRLDDWVKCRSDHTQNSLIGQRCYAGLDLAKTRDTTALVLCFPEEHEETCRLLAWFWLPEHTADEQSLIRYRDWEAEGHIELTPGQTCDYRYVKARIAEIAKVYDVKELAYDPYNAEQVTQEIEDELDIPRVSFPQTILNFAEPTKEFERLVIDGKMKHNQNPVLDWQVGNALVKTDPSGNIRPVRREANDHRKIDGVVAAVMALARAMQGKDEESVYEHRGLLVL